MRKLILLPLAVLALALLVACSGDKKDDTAIEPGGGGGASGQTLDIAKSTAKLTELRSFRFDLKLKLDLGDALKSTDPDSTEDDVFGAMLMAFLSDIKAEGAFVAPADTEMKMNVLGMDVRYVKVGDRAWVYEGGNWTETDATAMGGPLGDSPLDMAKDFLPQEALKVAKTSSETVNGVKTTHYSFDKAALESIAEQLGEVTGGEEQLKSANLDIWVTEDGIPVKIVLKAKASDDSGADVGIELEMNITDINADIKIKPPV
ncbi:MAG TPA: hypothetical protein VI759_00215 [Dehalococcoidia bacterium]|nr:hypothetical protein [Dehalococcoidia bacterium]